MLIGSLSVWWIYMLGIFICLSYNIYHADIFLALILDFVYQFYPFHLSYSSHINSHLIPSHHTPQISSSPARPQYRQPAPSARQKPLRGHDQPRNDRWKAFHGPAETAIISQSVTRKVAWPISSAAHTFPAPPTTGDIRRRDWKSRCQPIPTSKRKMIAIIWKSLSLGIL